MKPSILEADVLKDVKAAKPTLWINPNLDRWKAGDPDRPFSAEDVVDAGANWRRFAPLLARIFPELEVTDGIIESPLTEVPGARRELGYDTPDHGRLLVKADHDLPVAGSIKARGGIYEVFMFAEALARKTGLLTPDEALTALADDRMKSAFSAYTIAVGSTGNLGLSVGIAAKALGFQVVVHMSVDAKPWKVDRLTRIGATVVQHDTDYTSAVEAARDQADSDEKIYFVDDEQSKLLFLGYSAATLRLAAQLEEQEIPVDSDHPLFLYLPCGIGGAPGGITFGAKSIFGDNVHCFFVEPVQSPCALVQLMSRAARTVSVYEFGLTNKTEADGMAVASFSKFLAGTIGPMVSGVLTVNDDDLFRWLYILDECEGMRVEPSGTSGCAGPNVLTNTPMGRNYVSLQGLQGKMKNATHVIWTTGGRFVPDDQYRTFRERGRSIALASV
ncbi:D-serine ammonia-lyase [Roseibium sp. SCP14]|uniref:D-serine ammonia-lyase n=1 Tax=Roseibium sp. SCP14 TaxID=3141375 RepID=UPI0033399E89